MGGKYPPDASRKDAEYNFMKDAPSAALIAAEWPTPVLFNGEGGSTNSGRRVTFEMPEHNPLTVAYTLYPNGGHGGDRLSWDPVSCLVAVRGAAPWYDVVSTGKNAVDAATGINTWHAGEARAHRLAVAAANAAEGVRISTVELVQAIHCRPRVEVAAITLDQPLLTLAADTRSTLKAAS